jgi:small subunit ribosomal protein S16
MAVKLRLKRLGRTHQSFFRLNAIDSRNQRDGRVLEELGLYDPHAKTPEAEFRLNDERIKYWLSVGAQPTDTVANILKKHGITTAK